MSEEEKDFDAGYESGISDEPDSSSSSLIEADREFPIETRDCVTGDEVKHSFCRYPDPVQGTMMVMSRESMLRFTRPGQSLSGEFERVLDLRRKQEKRIKKSS